MAHDVDHEAILGRLAEARGGVRNIFEELDPARTAHLIVDMQNGFLEEGAPVEVPAARGIVGAVNRLSAAVREAGGRNIFLRYTTPWDMDRSWSVFLERMGVDGAVHRDAFKFGAHHHELWPELDVAPNDRIVDKHRFSGFTHDTSNLADTLEGLDIDTVIISGTLTNCCCESTARDAMQMNYRVIMAADANAALSDEEHAATLHSLGMVFADLRSVGELTAMLADARQPA